MGRPPCCDQVGIKKGPWTPEEDIILVSYIQEHGPGNWRSVPTNTGLLRCSKSCRLRWTNYLRPGIKRGNFTPHEEGMIVHLQALLGNKWAAIASYLPQRTDNDIKNYWNTHLKKKLKKFQALDVPVAAQRSTISDEMRGDAASSGCSSSSMYASSTENISRLLEGWMRSSPNSKGNIVNTAATAVTTTAATTTDNNKKNPEVENYRPKVEQEEVLRGDLMPHEEFESMLCFENLKGNVLWDKTISTCDQEVLDKQKPEHSASSLTITNPPLSFLEKWLFDETTNPGQVEEMIELPSIF